MPIAKPTRAGSSPPGYLRASSENTGNTRNRPSMRKAKINASELLARRSCGVMVVELGATPAAGIGIEEEDKAVIRGLAKKAPLSRIPWD